jgi:LAO/AO transport system kinase
MWNKLLAQIQSGDRKALARCISLVENEAEGYYAFLKNLPAGTAPVTGITGPPGAGKSTLTDALINLYVQENKKVAVLCVDPSSAFNMGALLGDRIRMSQWYNEPGVYIRSLATRGSLGGLHPKIIEITDILKAADFDQIIVETVGVGQSEIEIAGLADITVVVIVPEAGDEIQTMKSGVMEIADLFVVNKADRPGADTFVKNLRLMLAPAFSNHAQEVEVIKTVASNGRGILEMKEALERVAAGGKTNERKAWLLAEKAYYLLQKARMSDIDKNELKTAIEKDYKGFNLYQFVSDLLSRGR